MWTVTFDKQATRALQAMDAKTQRRILDRIAELARDPKARNNNVKKLQGIEGYRLRVGEWRVVYRLKQQEMVIVVVKIGDRRDVYR